MSRRDLPLWARGVAAVLLLVASWWLLRTHAVSDVVGASVALVGLGVVAASILRGMGMPLGLWPLGPWRDVFWAPLVVIPSVLIATIVLVSGPMRHPELVQIVDPGIYFLAAIGAVGLGYSVAMVAVRPFLIWWGVAVVVAIAPTVLTIPMGGVESTVNAEVCWLTMLEPSTGSGCVITYPRASIFLVGVAIPVLLVSTELAFRRLLLGTGGRAGVVAILFAAAVATAWSAHVAHGVPLTLERWWLAAVGAATAGSLYALSRSLVVSATYSAVFVGGLAGVSFAAMDPAAALVGLAPTGTTTLAHAAVAVGLLLVVARRNGLFAGLR